MAKKSKKETEIDGTTPRRFPLHRRIITPDSRTLPMRRYIKPHRLPPTPASVMLSPAVLQNGGYPMYLNDSIGDCAIAGAAHMIQTWTANASKIAIPADSDVLSAYRAVSGYDPAIPSTDTGCNLLAVLRRWRKTGIAGHKIGAFVGLNPHNITEVQHAIWLFGGVMFGVSLPDSVLEGDMVGVPWDESVTDAPNPENGHCIVGCDYNYRSIGVGTWGTVKNAANRFISHYADEAYALISSDWLDGSGKCPVGIDLVTLSSDLALVTADLDNSVLDQE